MKYPGPAIDDRLLTEDERKIFGLLPRLCSTEGSARNRIAVKLADAMGNAGEFGQYVSGSASDRLARIDRLLRVFSDNVGLLINKTWVEKAEEQPKARLLADLATFENDYRRGASASAFRRFVALAHSIASLLFGHQSRDGDFLEYCFRIDPKFGLFFWFVGEMEKQTSGEEPSEELMNLEVLVGVFVVSSF